MEEEQKEQYEKTTLPIGFVATPDDIAKAYLYLVKADYATSTNVVIDGGFSCELQSRIPFLRTRLLSV
jgi:NAD(P)-dependent dehydrogenase (short-subunit alcohol dehydrogenase family)